MSNNQCIIRAEHYWDAALRPLFLPVLVGLQLDSHEDVAELRCQWSNATNLELYHDTAVTGQQLALGKRDVD